MRTGAPKEARAASPSRPATLASRSASRAATRSRGRPLGVQAPARSRAGSEEDVELRIGARVVKPRLWRTALFPAKPREERPLFAPCYRRCGLTPFARRLLALWLLGLLVRVTFLLIEPPTGPVADERMWVVWGADVLPSPEVALLAPALPADLPPALLSLFHRRLLRPGRPPGREVGPGRRGLADRARPGAPRPPGLRAGSGARGRRLRGLSTRSSSGSRSTSGWRRCSSSSCTPRSSAWSRPTRRPRGRVAAAAGALFGLSVLARETALYFLPVAAVWLAWRRPDGGRRAAALLLAAACVIAPWTLRNASSTARSCPSPRREP